MSLKHYRQGDILVIEKKGSARGKKISNLKEPVILAHGEATGHKHAFRKGEVDFYESKGVASPQERVLSARKLLATLRHEEHAIIEIPKGEYSVIRQTEYVPQAVPRMVAD